MQVCPRPDCRRAGDDVGTCADKTLGCPRFKEVKFDTYIIIHCASCSMTRGVPVSELMRSTRNPLKCLGDSEGCKAVPLHQDPRSKPSAPTKKKA